MSLNDVCVTLSISGCFVLARACLLSFPRGKGAGITFLITSHLHAPRKLSGSICQYTMAQTMSGLMSGLSLNAPPSPNGRHPTSSTNNTNPSSTTGTGNRLPPLMKKYMNPGLVRPPNTGLLPQSSSTYGDAQRGPLLKLAGANVPVHSPLRPTSSKQGAGHGSSPPTKSHHKPSLSQHTAHGLHGPAHSTTSRALSSSINPHHATHPSASGIRKVEIGKYDGGLEADEVGKDVVSGDAAKLLELDSSNAGYVIRLCGSL